MSVYLEQFDSREDVEREFECTIPPDAEILLAWYGAGSCYDAESFVLYRQAGKLYEVNGYHCSCHGLEGQWEPEETSIAALRMRTWTDYYDAGPEATTQLHALLDQLEMEAH